MATEEYQTNVIDNIQTTCVEKLNAADRNGENSRDGCRKIAMEAIFCAHIELFKSCPIDKQDISEECEKLRQMGPRGKGPQPPQEGEN